MRNFKDLISKRIFVQGFSTFLTNIHISNFFKGTIYTGKMKKVCVPGLNCYSCPGATGSCPIGSFQAVVGSSKYSFSYYITGILILLGTIFGRLICGFLCPFGLFQDILYKIPFKKFSTKKLKFLKYIKYFILVFAVCIFPVIFVNSSKMGIPYFCKYICPQGVLEGAVALSLKSSSIRGALGSLFVLKFSILIFIIILGIIFYRPFCKWICPLGAFYSLFNRISIYQYNVDKSKCVSCGRCSRVCKMDVDISESKNLLECIRCGDCIKACPTNAIEKSCTIYNKNYEKGDFNNEKF